MGEHTIHFVSCLFAWLFHKCSGQSWHHKWSNRKRRILIQHQIKLGTFCIWLAQVDLFMRVLSSKLICVCSTKEIDPRLDCFVGIQEFCGGESDWHFGSQYREDTSNTRCYGAFSSIIFCLFSTIKEGSAKYAKVSRSFVEYQKRLSSKKAS